MPARGVGDRRAARSRRSRCPAALPATALPGSKDGGQELRILSGSRPGRSTVILDAVLVTR
ncbi:hypothetical protein ACFV0T_31170 [Streptomyces sp. NPDC059582]|uniref:hypothetical protein n=1 Tax=Streptomyces sp. NPDC059582 TaxID=3346875 RepID=UPI0036CE4B9A